MALQDKIVADMKAAMREKDSLKLETIRLLRAAIQRREIDERQSLDDQAVLQVVQKLVKQCNDAAGQFEQGGRADLAEKEHANITVLEQYLPEKLSAEEVARLIDEAIAQAGAGSMKDMGRVMGILKPTLQGKADMSEVSASIRSKLS